MHKLLINPNNPQQFIYADAANNKGKAADVLACCLPILLIVFLQIFSLLRS
ncbi:MAG: hypothetical protein J1E83_10425 [Lachnospiraceae bacterium]|nr:hypothetical protein [Lachnospiraceae bacterium]